MFPPVVFSLEVIPECSSTNTLLLEKRGPDFHGAALLALKQSAGSGRRGRSWWSVEGNLALSVGFRFSGNPSLAPLLPFAAGIALRAALSRYLPSDADLRLKWPNDLYLEDRKVAGMLSQARQQGEGVDLVLGIGVNLKAAPDLSEATFLGEFAEIIPGPEEFARAFLIILEQVLEDISDFPALKTRWENAARIQGAKLRILQEEKIVTAKGILPSGELLVIEDSGAERALASEEISLRFV
jgi:BirA family biotin operon repressor/biotin-[acetyl-CoA-carboxylase] ligase